MKEILKDFFKIQAKKKNHKYYCDYYWTIIIELVFKILKMVLVLSLMAYFIFGIFINNGFLYEINKEDKILHAILGFNSILLSFAIGVILLVLLCKIFLDNKLVYENITKTLHEKACNKKLSSVLKELLYTFILLASCYIYTLIIPIEYVLQLKDSILFSPYCVLIVVPCFFNFFIILYIFLNTLGFLFYKTKTIFCTPIE